MALLYMFVTPLVCGAVFCGEGEVQREGHKRRSEGAVAQTANAKKVLQGSGDGLVKGE